MNIEKATLQQTSKRAILRLAALVTCGLSWGVALASPVTISVDPACKVTVNASVSGKLTITLDCPTPPPPAPTPTPTPTPTR